MKKERKQYGGLKPKSLDFMLAIMFAIVSVSALWIGIWVAGSGSQSLASEALGYTARAFAGNFVGAYSWLVVVESVLLYGAIIGCCVLAVFEMARKKFKALAGLVALVLFAVSLALQLSFVVVYLFSEVSGLLSVFLMVFMVCELYVAYLTAKLSYCMVVKQSAEYGKYKEEFGISKPQQVAEPEPKEEKKEDAKEKVVEEKEEAVEEPQPEDEMDFVFTNSNDYKEYMYHDNVVKYMKDEKPAQKEQKPAKKVEEKEDSKFAGKGNNYTFEQKLKLAKPYVRNYFKELTTYFVSLGFTPALTKQGETFSYKNNKCASITTAGKNGLKLYYKLDVKDYENSTIPVKFVGDVRKYEKTPLLFVAKSDLAIKRAKKLMDDVKSKLN